MEQTVQDVMTREVVAVHPGTGFREAVRLVEQHRVDALPVVDDARRVVGVVTVGDLLLKEEASEGPWGPLRSRLSDRRRSSARTVRECMSRPVTVEPGASLCAASRLMHRHRVGGLPVVGPDGALAGIVTRSDLLRVFLHEDDEVCAEVQAALGPGSPVSCRVTDGTVRLDGQLRYRSDVERVLATVRRLPAVVGVEDHLRYEHDDLVPSGL